jgi:hypothetical protein
MKAVTSASLREPAVLMLLMGGGFMKYAVQVALGGMIFIPNITARSSGIQIRLRLLLHQSERF